MINLPIKEKLISEMIELKYAIDFIVGELDLDNPNLKTVEKFLFEELPEMSTTLQYRFDELEEETKVNELTSSTTIDNWRITDPQAIEELNTVYDTNHVFFEIERVESVELETRTIHTYIQVIGDGKHKYVNPTDEQMLVIEKFADREPDVQYSPVKE